MLILASFSGDINVFRGLAILSPFATILLLKYVYKHYNIPCTH
ncbi:hypothetical protein [Methanobrevibacter sp.]